MGKTLLVDAGSLKKILAANSAMAQSVIALTDLAGRLAEQAEADRLREQLDRLLDNAESIQSTVDGVIKDNR